MINLHFITSNKLIQTEIYRKKFTFKHSIFDPVFPGNLKKINTDQDLLQVFLHCLERNDRQTFINKKSSFPPVCMLLEKLASIHVFHFFMYYS